MEAEELIKKYVAGERSFSGITLTEVNLSQLDLSEIDLSGANLSIANLSGTNLTGANLSHAKLNVAKLNSAHLSGANLSGADLNVANLIRADLSDAQLVQAALIRAELMRAELSGANLAQTNLNGANLREAKLRQVNLVNANLTEADFRGTSLIGANLELSNMRETNFSEADMTAVNLRNTELRQADLSRAKLIGADLSGANLRWADLSEADLTGADLTGAKLSGANLRGANLYKANLIDASLVYADLRQANLSEVDWMGADLSGATLTGAKLYAVSRFGLKTEGLTCEWVDLSKNGDRTQIHRFTAQTAENFFHNTLPTVQIIIDDCLESDAHLALALAYHQIAQRYSLMNMPPNIEVSQRRTKLTFTMDSDLKLFAIAYAAILPFLDGKVTQENLIHVVKMIQSNDILSLLNESQEKLKELHKSQTFYRTLQREKFFQAHTQTILTNSGNRTLDMYHHSNFGKRFLSISDPDSSAAESTVTNLKLPPVNIIVNFIKGLEGLSAPSVMNR